MQVQVNTNQIHGGADFQEWAASCVSERLERFEAFLVRVEIHVSDENAQKAGAQDKRCQIELRPRGHQPLSVSHKADALTLAVEGAAEKARHALEHLLGKLDTKVVSTGHLDDPLAAEDPQRVTDALLQEEFLARQAERGKE